eukprot:gene4497-5602_t
MSTTDRKNKIQTVKGLINPDAIGTTMMHEHIIIDYLKFFESPSSEEERCCSLHGNHNSSTNSLADEKINLTNLHWIQYNYNKNYHNLTLDEHDVALNELALYKRCGGSTIVEVTTAGIGRAPLLLKQISEQSDLNIIMGAGYYLEKTIGNMVKDKSVQEMEDEIVKQVLEGVDETGIKCGIIGEVGCSWPLSDNEKKSLAASARAQKRTGVSITVHPGRSSRAPLEILNILKENGADLSRVVMGHIDRTVHDMDIILEIAKTGCTLEFDLFGMEVSNYPYGGDVVGMPNDSQRIEWISKLISAGFGKNVVVSQDIYTKHRLCTYGGHGYNHLLFNIVPRMLKFGITQESINEILINTPKRLLTIQ